MTKSDLQRARLDLLMKQAELLCLSGSDIDYNFVERSLEPAFEYLDTLEANADYGPLKACDICGGEIKAEWDKTHMAESCAGDIVKKVADLPPADRGEFTASLAPYFKKELSRVCVETGKPLSEWAIGTAIDGNGEIFEYAGEPGYITDGKVWQVKGSARTLYLGWCDLAGRDPSTTWREYPKADK